MSQLMAGPPPGKRWSVDGPTWQRILAEVRRELRAEVEMELADRESPSQVAVVSSVLKRLDSGPEGTPG